MGKTHSVWTVAVRVAAIFHLILVSLGALHVFPFRSSSWIGTILGTYSAYSGADNAYGYFAPSVASEWRAVFDLYDGASNHWTTTTWESSNPEIRLLLSTINGHFSLEDVRESLAASWAGTILGENPHASVVVVKAQAYLIPTMKDFRAGR